jgi:hypothetical protein
LSTTYSLSEIVAKACELPTREAKVEWIRRNNSEALRTILMLMYDKRYEWNIPNTSPPPYTPSPHVESQGMLYRQVRKLRYFIKGFDGERLQQYRREFLFIEMLESIDRDDAKLMEKVLMQTPPAGLPADVINEAMGLQLPLDQPQPTAEADQPKKRGRKPKNG